MDYLFEQGHFIEDQDNDLSQYGGRMENILKIRKALSYLTDKQHNVLIAHYINSLSFREIARRIDVNKSTVIHHSKMAEKN